jgi:CRP-like cAMP-binding protein
VIDLKKYTLRRSWLFRELEEERLEELSSLSSFRRVRKGELIFSQGERPSYLYIVSAGIVKQFKISSSGKVFTIVMNSTGDTVNMFALFEGRAYYVSAEAVTDGRVLMIPRADFLRFVEKNPSILIRIIRAMEKLINNAYERLCDCAYERVYQRVLNSLYMLYRKFGDSIPLGKEELANMAGTTEETVVRILKTLEAKGVLRSKRGQIIVMRGKELEDLCEETYLIPLYQM